MAFEKFESLSEAEQNSTMQRYYKLQSKIYDATRWSFLFGRNQIIREIPLDPQGSWNILEVGCGTGYNLINLAKRFPNAKLTGLDVSTDMVELSKKNTLAFGERVNVLEQPYTLGDTAWNGQLDLVLFSYSLTMINPQWKDLILQAKADLKPGGYVAVTDFHDSRNLWFKKHMANNHVRMDSHLTPLLIQEFTPVVNLVKLAYLGVWEYMVFVGRK
ncbi:methyltransferase domain-containing protein [Haliscomenobacter sp.]|uniref:class I SAM-dependent methyltransferase n=1 Tax=Haliscomenobacter sp. TaxID=2717303 RepID=UPI003364EF35